MVINEVSVHQFIEFRLQGGEYAIPITYVREIINLPEITALPDSPAYLKGVTNLRGSVIPVVNLKELLRIQEADAVCLRIIVIACGSITFGILVDDIAGVVNIEEASIESPEAMSHGRVEQVHGVAKHSGRLIVLLDPKKLIPLDDYSLLDEVSGEVQVSAAGDTVAVTKTIQTMGGTVQVKEVHNAKEFFEKRITNASDPRIALFNDMVEFMEAISNSDYEKADGAIQRIIRDNQGDLFKEVGKVTRKLHDAIRSFKEAIDPKIKEIAVTDMPNAVDKLQFVITKTEEAANRTMGIVEKYILTMDTLDQHIGKLKGPAESVKYVKEFKGDLEDDLTTVLTTQSFQDLTGQTIKKVITLVGDIESELVKLVATFGGKVESCSEEVIDEVQEKVTQSDVDDLLKNFGF